MRRLILKDSNISLIVQKKQQNRMATDPITENYLDF